MKRKIIITGCLFLLLALTGCGKEVSWNGKTEYFAELYMVDNISDPYTYVGIVDNVFVGTVESVEKAVIPKKGSHEDNFSVYKIRVDRNLKGELTEEIECSKLGGFRRDGTMALVEAELPDGTVIRDTGLPEAGKQYIFLSYSQQDGSIDLSEIFDNREADEALIAEYTDYAENQKPYERERFSSKYDQ